MALKLSDLVKKSMEKGYGSINIASEKPWSKGSAPILSSNTADPDGHFDIDPSQVNTTNLQQSNNNIPTNSQRSDNNVATNSQRSNNDSDNNIATNSQRGNNDSDNNVATNSQRNNNDSDNNVATNSQRSNNDSDNNAITNSQRSNNVSNNNMTTNSQYNESEYSRKKDKIYINIQALSGLQLNIFNKILTMKNKVNKEYFAQLNTSSLAKELNMDIRSLRVSIDRLVQKNLLIRENGFMGRNGSCNFKIPNHILKYKDEIDSVKKTSFELTDIYNNNITTITSITKTENSTETLSEVNDWWNKLNINQIEEYGFQKAQFKQLAGLNKFEIVQESINHFAWGLKYNSKNEKYKINPSRVLLTVLKRGEPWIEDGYQDPEELAMARILDSKKKSAERKKKLEDEMYTFSLQEWMDSLTSKEIEKIVPNERQKGDLTPPKARLSNYFKENIWSIKKTEYLATND